MPAAVRRGWAESAKNLAPLSGTLRSTRRVNGSAATARRRAADVLGFSNESPKQNTTRSADETTPLSHRTSSSGCATTTAVGDLSSNCVSLMAHSAATSMSELPNRDRHYRFDKTAS